MADSYVIRVKTDTQEEIKLRVKDNGDGTYSIGTALLGRNVIQNTTATIANGASLSGAVNLGGNVLAGLIMPAAWTTADITFAVAKNNTDTPVPLFDDQGNEVKVTSPAASRGIALDSIAGSIAPWPYIYIRSGTSATAVNQAAERVITLVFKG